MIRFGIAGLGNIGQVHLGNLREGRVAGATVTAAADPSAERREGIQDIDVFEDLGSLLAADCVDAVVLAAPTGLHAPMAIEALQAGVHVILEKPLALHKAEGERILAARQRDDQVFSLMMNQRCNPLYLKIKAWMDEGAIGRLQRTSWTMTNWFRPEIYFQASDWRATWKGEGGGVLMNQCPHNLDIFQWLCGMPASVRGYCRFGEHHDIEVEDQVTAYFEYPDGATGTFSASTGEYPGVNRLEIAGDRGLIIYENERCTLTRNTQSASEFSRTTDEMFGSPETEVETFETDEQVNQHAVILTNVVQAICAGDPLIAPATEGLHSLELADAMLYSTWTDAPVALPLDGQAFEQVLQQKMADSKPRTPVKTAAKVDMSKSYR